MDIELQDKSAGAQVSCVLPIRRLSCPEPWCRAIVERDRRGREAHRHDARG